MRSGGHFALILLNVENSEATVYCSLNQSFDKSPYFLSTKIKAVIAGMLAKIREHQMRDVDEIYWSQAKLKAQNDSDCSVHVLTNAELIMQGFDPARQEFTREVMELIRLYHVLLKEEEISGLRIKYLD